MLRPLLGIVLLGLGCGASPRAAGLPRSHGEVIDLSYSFDKDTVYWPTETSGFQHKPLSYGRTEGGYFYSAYTFCTAEHGGTHLDAPIHFAEGGATADAIPLDRLIGQAVVIDMHLAADENRDALLEPATIEAFEKQHGPIAPGSIVLIRTGWGSRWPDRERYLGTGKVGDTANLHFPGVSKAAAQLLVARRVASVGIDTASIDHGPSTGFSAHVVLNGADIPVFENVANLSKLPARGAFVIALPMKIGGGSGGPLRIVALLEPIP